MSLKVIEKRDYIKIKIPGNVQDIIPIKSITSDGISDLGNGQFSKTYEFSDIDFSGLDDEDKEKIFFKYSDIINSWSGTNSQYKLSIVNRNKNTKEAMRNKLLNMFNDGFDDMREAYNDLRHDDVVSKRKELFEYLTVTTSRGNIVKAKSFFDRLDVDLNKRFLKIKSHIKGLKADDKLNLVYDILNCGNESVYVPWSKCSGKGRDYKSHICPNGMKFHPGYFEVDGMVGRAFRLRELGRNIKENFIRDLSSLDINFVISLYALPLSTAEIDKLLEDKDSDVEASVNSWSNSGNARNNRAAVVPRRLKSNRKILDEYTEDVNERGQKISLMQLTMVIIAKDMTELDQFTETIEETASEHTCNISNMWFMQYEGLINTIPFGIRCVPGLRDCNTETLAMLLPFNAQKIQHDSGIPYGKQISTGEQVFIDRRMLVNGNEIILGTSGSGKSLNAKLKSIFETLVIDGNMIYIDPDGEYSKLAAPFGGKIITIGIDSINAMEMSDGYGYGYEDPVKAKSNFILSLFERILDKDSLFDEIKKSITDRCINIVHNNAIYYGTAETLTALYYTILDQPEPEAGQLALSLERHIKGSFNVFAMETNVDTSGRILVFDLSRLDKQLKSAGMLVCLDYVNNILARNRHYGIPTYIKLDEMDEYLKDPASCAMVETFFQRARKYGGFVTGIIQNITKLLDVPAAKTMLKNSENVIMMRQAPEDAAVLAAMYRLSDQDVTFLENAEAGFGINKIGNNIFQFDGTIPKNNLLYQFVNTDGHNVF